MKKTFYSYSIHVFFYVACQIESQNKQETFVMERPRETEPPSDSNDPQKAAPAQVNSIRSVTSHFSLSSDHICIYSS